MCECFRVTPGSSFQEWPTSPVTSLVIADCPGSFNLEQVLKRLIQAPRDYWKCTKQLRLENVFMEKQSVTALVEFLLYRVSDSLESIEFSICGWFLPSGMRKAFVGAYCHSEDPVLSNSCRKYLTSFSVENWNMYRAANALVTGIIEACDSTIRRIVFNQSDLGIVHRPETDGDVSIVSVLFSVLSDTISEIDLSDNLIADTHLVVCRPILGPGSPPGLSRVGLSKNELTDLGLICLLTSDVNFDEPISDSFRASMMIDLSFNGITLTSDSSFRILNDALALNPHLTIDLTGNPLVRSIEHRQVFFDDKHAPQQPRRIKEPINEGSSTDDSEFIESSSSSSSSSDSGSSGNVSLVSEGSDLLHLLDDSPQ